MSTHSPADLQRIYETRFQGRSKYRRAVWRILIDDFFQQYVRPNGSVLDLGAGYGEFISQIRAERKFAMDLNPEAPGRIGPGVTCLVQDCSTRWPLAENSLDVVFTSNFFEHLPDKATLGRTLDEIRRCLKPRGCLIALGPNIRYLPGAYWDFWDHYLPLTDRSLAEALVNRDFLIDSTIDRFLPYTMSGRSEPPLILLRWYIKIRWAWRIFGKQFLIVATKPQAQGSGR